MSRPDHMDVAAYALGVLDEQDTERFEEHLATCWACAAELETMVPVVGLLSDIDGETMMALEQTATDPALLDRTLVAVRADRRRTRFRQLLATAAAVVVFGGLTGIGFVSVTDNEPPGVLAEPTLNAPGNEPPTSAPTGPPSGPGVGGNEEVEGDQVDATDPTTGVQTTMFLVTKDYGTRVNFSLQRLPGPLVCRLVVQRKNSTTEVISSWSVPPGGYGTNARPQGLELSASTSAPIDDIKQIQVQSVNGNGVASPLVTVPM
ncbi:MULTISPECIES: anti-sigma factor [unclassified Micromonospora]|uniref:anti-sigma factor family protein n=1 Tax=unclassified Micromonospora TaxID=2617518 RepID=UPI000EF45323|nr:MULTISPECIES: zf-HC2 domain-containing protein [unclassified Micromonospora]RLP85330.1 RNA polymerase subunit sigma [Micromonospora sp. BL4]RLP94293.1 RNA polymerase subunit sigma [Micromonospora sp. CV4]